MLPPIGTHKGHHCQEGVRIWPGSYARRQARLTVLLDTSSQLLDPVRHLAKRQARAPAAAQRRGRTSLTSTSGGRSSTSGEGPVCKLTYERSRAGSRCVRNSLVSTDPAPPLRAGGCHDHVIGAHLLSHVIERGPAACRKERAHPGLGGPPVLTTAAMACWPRPVPSRRASAGRGSAACGQSRRWRFLPRRFAMAGEGGDEGRGPPGGLRGVIHGPQQARRDLLGASGKSRWQPPTPGCGGNGSPTRRRVGRRSRTSPRPSQVGVWFIRTVVYRGC